MTSLEMEQQQKKTMVGAEKTGQNLLVDSFSSSTSSSTSGISSGSSLESDSFEEVTSPCSSSSSADPLSDMSSLFLQLPIKRGLSRHYQGKSQSFTSWANVRSVEDLAKPENPLNKRLKSCRSYGGGLGDTQKVKSSPNALSRPMSKKGLYSSSRGSCSSTLGAKRGISRPPIPPHRSNTSTTIAAHAALFA
ncbi:hypothetical protein L6164_030876 [Bauhinia variegata]|uniref:Uncharacterized protein n=1 Tax=Bauhinia variegata TaxID=167791 RepID=A0ACB9LDP8_BAUVA|nr:hypothetical protein L6164_030876 [Bauhinia variegata]